MRVCNIIIGGFTVTHNLCFTETWTVSGLIMGQEHTFQKHTVPIFHISFCIELAFLSRTLLSPSSPRSSYSPALHRPNLAGRVIDAHGPTAPFRGGAGNPRDPALDAPHSDKSEAPLMRAASAALAASAISSSLVMRVLGGGGPNSSQWSNLSIWDFLRYGCLFG